MKLEKVNLSDDTEFEYGSVVDDNASLVRTKYILPLWQNQSKKSFIPILLHRAMSTNCKLIILFDALLDWDKLKDKFTTGSSSTVPLDISVESEKTSTRGDCILSWLRVDHPKEDEADGGEVPSCYVESTGYRCALLRLESWYTEDGVSLAAWHSFISLYIMAMQELSILARIHGDDSSGGSEPPTVNVMMVDVGCEVSVNRCATTDAVEEDSLSSFRTLLSKTPTSTVDPSQPTPTVAATNLPNVSLNAADSNIITTAPTDTPVSAFTWGVGLRSVNVITFLGMFYYIHYLTMEQHTLATTHISDSSVQVRTPVYPATTDVELPKNATLYSKLREYVLSSTIDPLATSSVPEVVEVATTTSSTGQSSDNSGTADTDSEDNHNNNNVQMLPVGLSSVLANSKATGADPSVQEVSSVLHAQSQVAHEVHVQYLAQSRESASRRLKERLRLKQLERAAATSTALPVPPVTSSMPPIPPETNDVNEVESARKVTQWTLAYTSHAIDSLHLPQKYGGTGVLSLPPVAPGQARWITNRVLESLKKFSVAPVSS